MNIPAGRELDALIAEKVFGCKVKRPFNPAEHPDLPQKEYEYRRRWEQGYKCECPGHPHAIDDGDYYGTDIKEYSTRIQDAWEVVERVSEFGKFTRQFNLIREYHGDRWNFRVWFAKDSCDGSMDFMAEADTAPHAICMAALKALA